MVRAREAMEELGLTFDHIRKRKDIGVTKTEEGLMITEEGFKILQEEVWFKSISIPSTEAQQISGLSKHKLCNRLKQGEEWRLIGNKVYVNKEALERLMEERNLFKEFVENSVTLSQASVISGINRSTIRKHLKEGQEWIAVDGGVYVNKKALERLMEERGVNPLTQMELTDVPTGYTLLKEICEKNGLDYHVLRDRVRFDLSQEVIKVKNRLYLKDEVIPDLVEEYNCIQNFYKRSDLVELLDITMNRLISVLDEIKKDVEWRQIGKFEYFNKDMIDQKIVNYGGATQYYEACKRRAIGESPNTIEINNETFISVNSIQQFYNLEANGTIMSSRMLRHSIGRGAITNAYEDKCKVLYVSKKELDSIANTLEYSISLNELNEELMVITGKKAPSNSTVLTFCPDDVEVFNFNIFGQPHNRIRTQNPKQFRVDFIKRAKEEFMYRNSNPHERYEFLEKRLTREQKAKFPFTLKSYKAFVFTKLNNSKSNDMLNLTHELFKTLERFLCVSLSEAHLLSDEKILDILSSDELTGTDRIHLSNYLNHLKRKYPQKCLFKNEYNRYREVKAQKIDDIYSLEEWCAYFNFLTDTNKHIQKAFERYAYAKRWLYAVLHFSVAWRSEDLLETPALDFLDIDKYSLVWFINNDFQLSDGQIIINSVKRLVEDRYTRKTGARKHFVVPIHFVIPVSIAIIATEYHRRRTQSLTLFSIGKIEPVTLKNYLGEEMKGFSNLKANRSLISYCYNEAIEKEGYTAIAYSLGSYLRSHKPNMYQKAETTSQYIYALNKDGDINSISNQLFRRGIFGWLYKVMIELAHDKEYDTVAEMTTAIEILQKELSANGIENISRYMMYELESRRSVINELLIAPEDQLKELIDQLILGNLTSKERSIYCIKPNNCPFPTQNSCKGCRYSIPTNYSLLEIGNELLVLLEKLSLTHDDDAINRQKYTFQFMRLLTVLNEAKREFDRIDPDYFKTFLPLKKIKDRMNETKHKFLNL